MRLRTPAVRVPLADIEADRKAAVQRAAIYERRVSSLLGSIVDEVVRYPACPTTALTIDDFRQRPLSVRRHNGKTPIRAANMSECVGIVFTTQDFLEDRVHRLILPKSGLVEYTRNAVNVDCQKLPSATIEIAGPEQFAATPDLFPSLNYCMGALVVEAAYGWANAFK